MCIVTCCKSPLHSKMTTENVLPLLRATRTRRSFLGVYTHESHANMGWILRCCPCNRSFPLRQELLSCCGNLITRGVKMTLYSGKAFRLPKPAPPPPLCTVLLVIICSPSMRGALAQDFNQYHTTTLQGDFPGSCFLFP